MGLLDPRTGVQRGIAVISVICTMIFLTTSASVLFKRIFKQRKKPSIEEVIFPKPANLDHWEVLKIVIISRLPEDRLRSNPDVSYKDLQSCVNVDQALNKNLVNSYIKLLSSNFSKQKPLEMVCISPTIFANLLLRGVAPTLSEMMEKRWNLHRDDFSRVRTLFVPVHEEGFCGLGIIRPREKTCQFIHSGPAKDNDIRNFAGLIKKWMKDGLEGTPEEWKFQVHIVPAENVHDESVCMLINLQCRLYYFDDFLSYRFNDFLYDGANLMAKREVIVREIMGV